MARLKYYEDEKVKFAEAFSRNMTDTEAYYIYRKLRVKYGLHQYLELTGRVCGNCSRSVVKLKHNPSIGILAHEVAHAIQYKKHFKGQKWHCRRHEHLMVRVMKVIEKNFVAWRDMANRKAEKRVNAFHRKEERKKAAVEKRSTADYRLQRLTALIKRWETKRKRAENALKKLRKKEKRILARDEKDFSLEVLKERIKLSAMQIAIATLIESNITWERNEDGIEVFPPNGKVFEGGLTSMHCNDWKDVMERIKSEGNLIDEEVSS
jgi:hypothetical protein